MPPMGYAGRSEYVSSQRAELSLRRLQLIGAGAYCRAGATRFFRQVSTRASLHVAKKTTNHPGFASEPSRFGFLERVYNRAGRSPVENLTHRYW